jgi:hypothetical protein
MTDALTLRLMNRDEAARLVDWAADEGWNPGLGDADLFWQTDPEAFVAGEVGGELVGGGAITSYEGRFGFMGLFIVRPEFRMRGLGSRLWKARVRLLQGRLEPGAAIGMDGVFEMQDWYAKGGFAFSHRSLRYEGRGEGVQRAAGIVAAGEVPFEKLAAYDRRCFPARRERFLRAWIEQPDGLALAATEDGLLRGFGVIRRCRVGAKIGPLFADDPATAESLYASLAAFVPDEPVFIDVPEVNAWAMALARRHQMREVFGCARMYLGPAPRPEESRIYGSTTFELG